MFSSADHVILQALMNSAVYRLVVNVQSDRAGAEFHDASPTFTALTLDEATTKLVSELKGRRSRVGLREERRRPTRERTPHPSQRGRP